MCEDDSGIRMIVEKDLEIVNQQLRPEVGHRRIDLHQAQRQNV